MSGRVAALSRARAQTETQITRAILEYLAVCRILAWRVNSRVVRMPGKGGLDRLVRFGGRPGMPDIAGVLPGGRALFLEVKRAGGVTSREQVLMLNRLTEAGALALIVYGVNDVRAVLRDLGLDAR